ncbi:MAG: hypothetical protein JJE51_13480 [Thermoanaerobaculia bacterium]|nr:hypothetical protein [Thermoanaerobaculia bacterium]
MSRLFSAILLVALVTDARAACMNKFVRRSEGPRQIVTLLTGKLTFQEAQALAASINKRETPPIEWVDDKGKTIAKQYGDLKVIRPMPVGCDGRKSGVVLTATFPSVQLPSRKMSVKLSVGNLVEFEEQKP